MMGLFTRSKQRTAHSDSESAGQQFVNENENLKGQLDALNRVQAIIRFAPDGTILAANDNFLHTMGYTLAEIEGKHHRIFVDPSYANSPEYEAFWRKLRRGEFERAEFRRFGKGGREVWLQASYNPVFDAAGHLLEIVKFATDITEEKLRNAEFQGKMQAIERVQGVIEFDMDGNILTANDNFLHLLGYTLDEVRGKHHRIFVDPAEANSSAYQEFWRNLRAGRHDTRVYKRIRKDGRHVWIQASYNPIFDFNGNPIKVVKFATDLTDLIDQTEATQNTAQNVATATEEMSCSIAEISHNMELSRQATGQIMDTSTASGAEASHLVESMKSMEKIVGLIREIAGRVNLLALNATIEAARAGEAGKGFAVVANEVKSLSDQTAKATNQIGQEISSVQSISASVAHSIQQTQAGVSQVNQYVSAVATAMEEQIAVTKEISAHSTHLVSAVEEILTKTRQGREQSAGIAA